MSRIKHVLAGLAFVAALVAVPATAQAATQHGTQATTAIAHTETGPACSFCW